MAVDTVVLDLDGTLVDSVPVHVLAWQAAFHDVGVSVPGYRIQRAIGMGGDRLVAALAGQAVEDALGDELRARHPEHLDDLFGHVVPTEGATELLESLRDHGVEPMLASSGDRHLTDRLLELVEGAGHLITHVVAGTDADQSKPAGDLVELALEAAGSRDAVVVGDAVWDVAAAADAGVPSIALLTGGISEAELRTAVHPTPRDLAAALASAGSLDLLLER
jgi:HAD superfamily hydrolase (TIGR01549 family)